VQLRWRASAVLFDSRMAPDIWSHVVEPGMKSIVIISFRAPRALLFPASNKRDEFQLGNWHRPALTSGRPAPCDERVVRHVIQELRNAAVSVLLPVEERAAQLRRRLAFPR